MKHNKLIKLEESLEDFKDKGFCSQGEIAILNSKINKIDELQNNIDFARHNVILNKDVNYFNDYSDDLKLFTSGNKLSDLIISTYVKMIDYSFIDEACELRTFRDNFYEIIEKYGFVYLEPIKKQNEKSLVKS